jgi:hypothetical protein
MKAKCPYIWPLLKKWYEKLTLFRPQGKAYRLMQGRKNSRNFFNIIMKLRYGLVKLILLFLLCVFVTSCFNEFSDLDNIKKFKWEPTIAVPIIDSEFSFKDFVTEISDSSVVYSRDDGLIVFAYRDTVISKTGESLITIPNQDFQYSNDLPAPLIIQFPFNDSIVYAEEIEFDFSTQSGQELDSILLKDGILNFGINWNFNQPGKLEIEFKSLLQNGQPITINHEFASSLNYSESFPLQDIKVDLTDQGTSTNSFLIDLSFTIYNNGNPLLLNPSFDINLIVTDPKFKAVFGELGSIPFNTDIGTTKLKFFENMEFGIIELEDPTAILTISNSFGMGVTTYIDDISIAHTTGTTKLEGSITTQPISVNAVPLANMGNFEISVIEINNGNSNLKELIKYVPQEIAIAFNGAVSNPGSKDFVLDNSTVYLDLMVELPLYGKVSELGISHDFDFDGSIFDDLDNALLQFKSFNEFPIDMTIQATFLSQTGIPLLEFFTLDNNLLVASENDLNGMVVNRGENVLVVELDRDDLETASRSEFIRLDVEVSTFNNGSVPVKILDSHRITFKVGLQSKFVNND